jgi:RNA polymerase sigma factor (sigma-70 family)
MRTIEEQAVRVAKWVCRRRGVPRRNMPDLIAAATVGILCAAKSYDPSLGKQESHAFWHGWSHCNKWLARADWPAGAVVMPLDDWDRPTYHVSTLDERRMVAKALEVAAAMGPRYYDIVAVAWLGEGTFAEIGRKHGISRQRVEQCSHALRAKLEVALAGHKP